MIMKGLSKRVLVALILGCAATNAGATLVHSDWQAFGDQLVTIDTNSGLQWLSFSQTTIGHQAIRDELTDLYAGFRFATANELQGLFAGYVPSLPPNGFMFGNDATIAGQLQFVMDAVGYDDATYRFVNTCEFALGCDPLDFGAGKGIHRHNLGADIATSDFAVWFNNDIDFSQVQALVRVPEPGTFGLALLAGLTFVALNRKRRRGPAVRNSAPTTE